MFRLLTTLLWILCLLALPQAWSDDGHALRERLQHADETTRLDDPTLKPWYLKLQFQMYDTRGKATETGTLEEWWASSSLRKLTITSPSYTSTVIDNNGRQFRTGNTGPTPYLLEVVERQMVHPMALQSEIEDLSPEEVAVTPDKKLDCIMWSKRMAYVPKVPLGVFPSYCFDHDHGLLQVSYDFGTLGVARVSMGMFQNRIMPIDLKVTLSQIDAVSTHLISLRTISQQEANFSVPTGSDEVQTRRLRVPYSEVIQTLDGHPMIGLPSGITANTRNLPVRVRLWIDTDGLVHGLRLEETPDIRLGITAMGSMLHWRYAPPHVKGQITNIETVAGALFNETY